MYHSLNNVKKYLFFFEPKARQILSNVSNPRIQSHRYDFDRVSLLTILLILLDENIGKYINWDKITWDSSPWEIFYIKTDSEHIIEFFENIECEFSIDPGLEMLDLDNLTIGNIILIIEKYYSDLFVRFESNSLIEEKFYEIKNAIEKEIQHSQRWIPSKKKNSSFPDFPYLISPSTKLYSFSKDEVLRLKQYCKTKYNLDWKDKNDWNISFFRLQTNYLEVETIEDLIKKL